MAMTMAERAFVIGVAGTPGSGKTTLLKFLQQQHYPRARAIHYDRFHPSKTDEEIQDWIRRCGDPNELELGDLIAALQQCTAIQSGNQHRPLVLFETAFGRAHHATGAFIDFQVWIDTPLDVALSRACLVFLGKVADDPAPNAAKDFVAWLTRYMEDYPMLRALYDAVRTNTMATADLVLDGTQAPAVLGQAIAQALAARGVCG
jgi:uridine kinase